MKYLRLELKVCEGCGVLWLRMVNGGAYCAACSLQLSNFPAPKGKRAGGRPRLARSSATFATHRRPAGVR
ncbi:MAG TPA: hypothetical protein VF865_21650 [Acidobacteriaceae bacterium]